MTLHSRRDLTGRLLRFGLALALVGLALALLVAGPRPPGMAGEIIQRNLEQDVQATALFYMDLERMPRIEERLALAVAAAREREAGGGGRTGHPSR